ncbi:MAG: TIGR00282 family metallophosphoesterase [Candidatus Dormibacteraeota bacterium]|nr:TIGR00282 family metallophosphoesterase [Candidatus Dormibacteraeota bacterium]
MRVLFVGDVIGRPGRHAFARLLPRLRDELALDLVVVNGENSAGGFGITAATALELREAGADVVTTGNHVWDHKQFLEEIEQEERIVRPANYPPGAPGRGALEIDVRGRTVLVVNLQGRTFMPALDDPFRSVDAILDGHPGADHVIVDMHAEATAEKVAMGWHLDGRASLVVGTHTHVPTADQRILPGGTAYVTDVGMVGPRDSVIGVVPQASLARFLTGMPQRNLIASGPVTFNSVLVTMWEPQRQATTITRIDKENA